jgi:hypothetical protein
MVWNIVLEGHVILWVEVTEGFLEWLRPSVRDALVAGIDPYADSVLTAEMQQRWLDELKRIETELQIQASTRIALKKPLPRVPAVRSTVQKTLVERELRNHPQAQKVSELRATLELALESGSTISALGD